jgi:hypothetical protein
MTSNTLENFSHVIELPQALPPQAELVTLAADKPWPPVFRGVAPTEYEKKIYGADAERCEQTGFIFELGSGALRKEVQTAQFKANLLNPEWARGYFRSDPNAGARHPKLLVHYRKLGVIE